MTLGWLISAHRISEIFYSYKRVWDCFSRLATKEIMGKNINLVTNGLIFSIFTISLWMKYMDHYADLINLLDLYACLLKLLDPYVGSVKLLDQNIYLVKHLEHHMDPVCKSSPVILKERGATCVKVLFCL